MAISIQIKRGSLDKINAASLKAAELALETGSNTLYTGIDGQAGTAVPVRAGSAATATKLAAGKDFSISGDVTATAVSFDGSANVELKATIPAASIDTDKLAAGVVTSLGKADSAVQTVATGTANGSISVDGADVAVKGLGSAAYKEVGTEAGQIPTLNNEGKLPVDLVPDISTKYIAVSQKGAKSGVAELGADGLVPEAQLPAFVKSVGATADKGIAIGGTAQAPTVGVVIDPDASNALTVGAAGLKVVVPTAAEYSVTKKADAGDYAAVYQLTKDGTPVGAEINIPKDMVVKSGEVVENPDATHTGTFLVLTLANATEDKVYINVSDLIEYVTSGSAVGDMVVIDVSADHKVTATITDGTVTKAKLVQAVQDSLGKADSALQAADIAEGKTNGSIAVKGTDVSVHGLGSAAFTDAGAYDAKGDAEAVKGTASDPKTAATVYGARALAQQGIDDAASALAEAQAKVASVTATDKSVVVTAGTNPAIKANISTTAGNALKLDDNGLFVATPAEYTAGTSISIDNHVISLSSIDCGELL